MSRLYNQDIIECEGALYDDAETLVAYAKEHYKEFIVYSDVEILDVRYDDGNLVIEYKEVVEYDENDNEVTKVTKEEFDVTPRDMMVTVR